MKKQALRILMLLGIAGLLALPSIYAQTSTILAADIPFDFVVKNQSMPAGEYTVQAAAGASPVLIQSRDSAHTIFVLPHLTKANVAPAQAKLVFNRYGDRYFLSQIWQPEQTTGRELSKSQTEREMASNGTKADTVQVALKRR